MKPRRAEIELIYEGKNISRDISPYLVSLSFTDNTGKADDLQIVLEDREGKWSNPWLPKAGDKITAKIILYSWYRPGSVHSVPCGTFEVDSINISAPPESVTVRASSLPSNSRLKNERNTKAWEKVTLSQIAKRIGAAAKLKVLFETDDVTYDRIDQTNQTDIAFLVDIADKEGVSVKVTNDAIVLFDDLKYESMVPVRKIERGQSDILSYAFDLNTVDAAYAACTVSYLTTVKPAKKNAKDKPTERKRRPTKKRTKPAKLMIKGSYRIPGKIGPELKLNERVASVAEAIKKAKKALRQKNKEVERGSLTLMGDYVLVQGVTVNLSGFGGFNGKYFIETATHTVSGSGYDVRLELRKVLGY
ncbi:phage late control D family protein [Paenibacillus sp. GCM10012307]|uniref:Late control protein n=1 Tax=Paenibacillus roseus TaxID=2798579 RepID=A0A934MQP0_9BACL|nr:contractile injection system protein, VgrG/Pvc8 family [Paenibacillus roseus]MBJ6362093.1 late control protein [Paenibacillus roseus]